MAVALVVWLAMAHIAEPQQEPAGLDLDEMRQVDRAVWDEMEHQHVVGLAVAVIRDARVAYVRGYGFADRENCVPVTETTRFRWASLSKPLTAVTALQLWEQGRLDLDLDIHRYLPEAPSSAGNLTSRLLLCHQGGLDHRTDASVLRAWRSRTGPHPSDDAVLALAALGSDPFPFPPGERCHYSTPGYVLLSAVVQKAGGELFASQVASRIGVPLKMTTLEPDRRWVRNPDRAVGYHLVDGKIVRAPVSDVSWKLGGGGYMSAIGDLARFAEGLLGHQLVRPSTSRLMWTPVRDRLGRRTHFGLGFKVQVDHKKRTVVWHDGMQPGVRTRLVLDPDSGFGIVLLSNSEHADLARVVTSIENALGR